MKNILLAVRDVVAWLFIVVSGLFAVSAIVMYPVVLSMLTSWWWLLGYVAYAIIAWVAYKMFF